MVDCLLHSCKGLCQRVDDKTLAGLWIPEVEKCPVQGWTAVGPAGRDVCGRCEGIRGLRQSSSFTGLIQRKDSGVSFWMEGKQNAWERAKGGSTLRWIQM